METQNVYDYITSEENTWATTPVPLTDSKDWLMKDHIERCFNVANGWFHKGKNDGLRPYKDIVTPIIDVAFRTEGFDVKDIVPFVDEISDNYKSFLVKKYHPKWARRNNLDTFIDEVVESSIIYDLVLVKDINQVRPEVVKLQEIAFCDQTDILSGPICIKHQYSIADLSDMKGKWDEEKIDELIVLSVASKEASMATDQKQKTPGRYVEVYELHGRLPAQWIDENAKENTYSDQMHIVSFFTDSEGGKNGITLFKGKNRPLRDVFKALKIDEVRSFGRACGRSIVERLFEAQVWTNYSEIRIKEMLDAAAVVLYKSNSLELGDQKLSNLKNNTVLKLGAGEDFNKVDTNTNNNLVEFSNHQLNTEQSARTLGSASEASLGKAPVSGTPFALQDLIVQQGEGIHEYRRGKIATFFADVLYRDLILKYLVKDMNQGKKFSEELTLDEMQEIFDKIATNIVNKKIKDNFVNKLEITTKEQRDELIKIYKEDLMKTGKRQFFEVMKGELNDIPLDVYVNVAGKQRYMAQNADKISKLLSNILQNPQAFASIPGIGGAYNQLLEESGMNPIDFSQIISGVQENPNVKTNQLASPVGGAELKDSNNNIAK